jgi:hypothetical protein
MLQLRHILDGGFLREQPGGELGLENGPGRLDPPSRVAPIHRTVGCLTCRWTSVKEWPVFASYQRLLSSSVAQAELDEEIAGEVLWLELASFFTPQT